MSRAEIIAANPIVDFVQDRGHALQRVGANFETSGCPLAQHKRGHRPVMIYPQTQSWSCHDCKVGGTVIDWVMREKNVSAADAMQILGGGRNGSELVATYDYTDEAGQLLYQVCRFVPKDFRQRRSDGNGNWIWNVNGVPRVLYQLPKVIASQSVIISEGEKDCNNLSAIGFTATCNCGGAGKWRDDFSETLRDKNVVIFGDDDAPGRDHVDQLIASLIGIAKSIKRVTLPDGFHDVSDYIESLPAKTAAKSIAKLIDGTPEVARIDKAEQVVDGSGNADEEAIARLAALPLLE